MGWSFLWPCVCGERKYIFAFSARFTEFPYALVRSFVLASLLTFTLQSFTTFSYSLHSTLSIPRFLILLSFVYLHTHAHTISFNLNASYPLSCARPPFRSLALSPCVYIFNLIWLGFIILSVSILLTPNLRDYKIIRQMHATAFRK